METRITSEGVKGKCDVCAGWKLLSSIPDEILKNPIDGKIPCSAKCCDDVKRQQADLWKPQPFAQAAT